MATSWDFKKSEVKYATNFSFLYFNNFLLLMNWTSRNTFTRYFIVVLFIHVPLLLSPFFRLGPNMTLVRHKIVTPLYAFYAL